MVIYKSCGLQRCSDRLNAMIGWIGFASHHWGLFLGAIESNRFVCIHMLSRIF